MLANVATVAQLAEQRFCNLTTTRPTGSKTRGREAHFLGYFLTFVAWLGPVQRLVDGQSRHRSGLHHCFAAPRLPSATCESSRRSITPLSHAGSPRQPGFPRWSAPDGMIRACFSCDSRVSGHFDRSTQWVTGKNKHFVFSLMANPSSNSTKRELHARLKAKGPAGGLGGLVRVQNKRREFLWVHAG